MANAFIGGASGASWDLLTETAYNRDVDWALRDMPQWRPLIDKRPTAQSMPGDAVVFSFLSDFSALATTPLTETVDPDAVALPAPTRITVTLNEYGNAALETLRLKELAFVPPDPQITMGLARNLADTMDALVRTVADGSTNLVYLNAGNVVTTGGSAGAVAATDKMNRAVGATTVSLLRRDKVVPKNGDNYLAVCSPDVLYDLMAENSATAWIAPHTYGGDTAAVYAGSVGTFMGAEYISTNRVTTATDGASAGKVYRSYFFGREALVEANAIEPHIVVGPQVDKLKRFFPIGWYGLLGWSLYRPQALRKVLTSSSLATLA